MQQEMALLGMLDSKPVRIDPKIVRLWKSEPEAMRMCQRFSRNLAMRDDETLARELGMSRSSLNTILNSDRHERERYMSGRRQKKMQRLCGNLAIEQWLQMDEDGLLACQESREEKRQELIKQLRELDD